MKRQVDGVKRRAKLKNARDTEKARKKRRHLRKLAPAIEIEVPAGKLNILKYALPVSLIVIASFLFSINQFEHHRSSNICYGIIGEDGSSRKSIGLLARNGYWVPAKVEEPDPAVVKLYADVIEIVKGMPMERMAEKISERDRPVAAFLVGIAMKESKFGKFSPKKEGVECFNYWGYRGKENTTKSGYSCFASPEEAIQIVGDKIESIVRRGVKTPEQMISWKCGRTCEGHSPESVDKWIKDVAINYYRLNPGKEIAKK